MIQRIQTLFLAIVSLGMGLLVMMPIWDKTSTDGTQSIQMNALQLVHKQGITSYVTPLWYVALLGVAVALVAMFAIFKFRNRLLQAGLCAVNSILMTVLMAVIMYAIFGKSKDLFEPTSIGQFGIGFYGLIIAMVANVVANRFIKRDEKLVRSQDRMR